ncbi:MAG: polymer-forming cytoskeletal protein [Acidobacteriota bacterium]|nr:polymer-forming cytoskeletal protein [Acidobacteriota bacterium]
MTIRTPRIRSIAPLGIGVWLVATLLASPASAFDCIGAEAHLLPEGETHVGDLYVAAQTVSILGTLEGDLIAGGDTVDVFGTVTGDLIAGGNFVTVSGTVHDAARLGGQKITVTGTIDGDLILFGQIVSLSHGAKVTGDVLAFGSQVRIDGDVDGDLITNGALVWIGGSIAGDVSGTAGQISLSGSLARNAKFKCDALKVAESTSIGGNLEYTAREEVENLEEMSVVAGTIDYQKTEKKTRTKKSKYTAWWFFRKFVAFVAALLTGFVLIRLFPRQVSAIQGAVGEPLQSFGVGFVIAIVLPVGALIVCVAIVTIPMAIITFLLYLIGLYLAKYPVALWLGRRLLGLLGTSSPSPYLALTVGLLPLVVLFHLPFLLGWLIWFVSIFVGMGAIFLGLQARARGKNAPGAGAPAAAAPPAPTTSPA